MKEFIDRIPDEGKANRKKITYSDSSEEYVFIENADEPTEDGTEINRSNLMAVQGFQPAIISIASNGTKNDYMSESYGESSPYEYLRTDFNSDGTITQTFTGEKTIVKTISFSGGHILGVIE